MTISSIETVAGNWNGSVSTDWATAANWDGSTLPGASTDAVVPGLTAHSPIIASAVSINSLTIGTIAAATVTQNAGGDIVHGKHAHRGRH